MNLVFTEVCVMVVFIIVCPLHLFKPTCLLGSKYVDGCCVYLCVYCHFVCVSLSSIVQNIGIVQLNLTGKLHKNSNYYQGINTITTKVK